MGDDARMTEERRALIVAVGVDLDALDSRTRAAVEAFGEEVLALRRDVATLTAALADAEALADFDTLCPVFNRRAFERELRREIALADRYGSPFCVVFIDLDGFKSINDRFGHGVGDQALIAVAEVLTENTRETDIVGRIGGDEFAVLLTHANAGDSLAKAADLVAGIEAVRLRVGPGTGDTVSPAASFGIAEWRKGAAVDTLIASADQAMYAQKAERRALSG